MPAPSKPEPTVTVAADDRPAYVLVIVGGASRRLALAEGGRWTIGRSEECDIRIEDASVSRRHARLELDPNGVEVVDLGSHNGTRVNGRRVEERCEVVSGDVIALGEAILIPYLGRQVRWRAGVADRSHLLERLAAEADRAVRFERPLAVMLVELRDAAPATLAALLRPVLRPCDTVGFVDEGVLLGVLPELGAQAGEAMARKVIAALAACVPERAGMAVCPTDGADAASLLAAARGAARSGADLGRADSAPLQVGDRAVLVADPGMLRIYDLLRRLAASDIPVLLSGETGVGKEIAAYALHAWSPRADRPFVPVNCAALPENLVESELFGYRKGAFSGADRDKAGLFETAAGGTLFLDEVGELPLTAQAKLLRVLDSHQITKLGGVTQVNVDVRVLAATNRDLPDEVAAGRFRDDLYYRLNAAPVILPPLRDRPRDIPLLARAFLGRACTRLARPAKHLSDATLRLLAAHGFPGNVRELANAMDYAASVAADEIVEPWHLPPALSPPVPSAERAAAGDPEPDSHFRPIADEIVELEKRRMAEALAAAGGNQSRAADLIGMPRRTFVSKLAKHGLRGTGE